MRRAQPSHAARWRITHMDDVAEKICFEIFALFAAARG
jgi:hypothetical protein